MNTGEWQWWRVMSLLSFEGTIDREQDASCDLTGFMCSSYLVLLPIFASLTVLSVTFPCSTVCMARSKYKGSCKQWLKATAIFLGKKSYWGCQPSKYSLDQEKFKWAACLGGEEHRLAALCMADVNQVVAACIHQGCSSGVWSCSSLGVSSVWKCKQHLLD